jgi:hypothetical protein
MNLQMQALEKVGENIFLLVGAASGFAVLISYYLLHVSKVRTHRSFSLLFSYACQNHIFGWGALHYFTTSNERRKQVLPVFELKVVCSK